MKKISVLIIIFLAALSAGFFAPSCEKVGAEIAGSGDVSADDWLWPTFTFMNLKTGLKTDERIMKNNSGRDTFRNMNDWNSQNGDIFFFRGNLIQNYYYDYNIYGDYLAIVSLEENFYWNGIGIYYDGFVYQIMSTENGLRIYNTGLWTLKNYCVIVQAGSSLTLPDLGINREMLGKIHKFKVKRGHLKVAKMNPNVDGAFTPPGLVWQFYKNQGKEIRKSGADEYLKAEDFIAKTDAENGYFQSLTTELQIKRVSIYNDNVGIDEGGIDCSKVY